MLQSNKRDALHCTGRLIVAVFAMFILCKAMLRWNFQLVSWQIPIKFLLQTGTGHFSPIGGYHAGKDMALILDVARFKYPPHWVPLKLLWEAMDHFDETTGQRRG